MFHSTWNINGKGRMEITLRTRLFVEMWMEWRRWVPETLSEEDPEVLLSFIEYADVRTGINQGQLQKKLGIQQSRLSKLTAKLRAEGWIEDLHESDGDNRVRRIRIARKARGAIRTLASRLSSVFSGSSRRRLAPRGLQLPTLLQGDE